MAENKFGLFLTKNVVDAFRFTKGDVAEVFKNLEIQVPPRQTKVFGDDGIKTVTDPRRILIQKLSEDRYHLRLKNGRNVRFIGVEEVKDFVPEVPAGF